MAKLKCARPTTIASLNGLDGVRKIESVTDTVGIYKDSDTQEYIVKVKGKPEQDYFAADRRDAEATALEMVSKYSPVVPIEYEDLNHVRTVTSGRWTMREKELVFAVPYIFPFGFISNRRLAGGVPEIFSWKRGDALPHRQYLAPEFIAPVMVALDQYLAREGSQLGALGALGARSLNFDPARVNYQDAIEDDFNERASRDDDEIEEEDDGTDSPVDYEDDELVAKARQHKPKSLEAKILPIGTDDELVFYSNSEEDAARFPAELEWKVNGEVGHFVLTLRSPGYVFYGRQGARLPLATQKAIELNLPTPTMALPALAPSRAMRAVSVKPSVTVRPVKVDAASTPVKVAPRPMLVRRVVGGQTQVVTPQVVMPAVKTVAEVANVVVAPSPKAPIAPESQSATAVERAVAKKKAKTPQAESAAVPAAVPLAQPRKKLSQLDKGARPKRDVLPVSAAQRAINDARLKNSVSPDFIAKFTPPLGVEQNGVWIPSEWPSTTPMSAMEIAKDALEGGQMLYDAGERAISEDGSKVAFGKRVSRFVARHYRTKLEIHVELERFGLGTSHLVIDIERLRLRLEQAQGDAVEVETIDRQGRPGRLTFSRSIAAAFAAWCARLGNSQLGRLGGLGAAKRDVASLTRGHAVWFKATVETKGTPEPINIAISANSNVVRIYGSDTQGPEMSMTLEQFFAEMLLSETPQELQFLFSDIDDEDYEDEDFGNEIYYSLIEPKRLLQEILSSFGREPKLLQKLLAQLTPETRVELDELYEAGTLQGLQGIREITDQSTDQSITVDAIEWDRNWRAKDRAPKKIGPVTIRFFIMSADQAGWAWTRLGVTVTRSHTHTFSTIMHLPGGPVLNPRAYNALLRGGERISFMNTDHSFEIAEDDRQGVLVWIDRMKELGLLRDPAEVPLPEGVHY